MSDILLAPDVRPFAVAAAIMASLGGIELLSMLVGFSIGELFGKDVEVEADSHNALGGLFLWINAGRLPLLILIILALGILSIEGFLLQGAAQVAGTAVPVWIATLIAIAGSIPVIRATSRGISRIIPRDESYAVDEADFVGHVGEVSVRSTRDCRDGFVSRMSSATGTRCRRAPVPIRNRFSSAPASCWSTATRGASSPFPHPPISSHKNDHQPGHKNVGACSTRRHWRYRHSRHRPDLLETLQALDA